MRKVTLTALLIFFLSSFIICETAFSDDVLKISGESFPPYKYVEDGKITGIDIEIARHIFDTLGVRYQVEIVPWARCWMYLQKGGADVGLAVSKKLNREEYVYYPENHVWEASFVLLTNNKTKARYDITSLDDVKKYDLKVGVIRGNSYHELFWEAFPWQDSEKTIYHPQLAVGGDIEECLRILDHNRINVYPVPKTIGLYTAKKMGFTHVTYYDFVIFSKPYPNVFSKASVFKNDRYKDIVELMKAYDNELGKFKKTPEYQEIFDKYEK